MSSNSTSTLILVILLVAISLFTGYISADGIKSQNIRLLDVFFIGPVMIYCGFKGYKLTNQLVFLILVFLGGSTISYNLRNYNIIGNSENK